MTVFGDYRKSLAEPALSRQAGRDWNDAFGEIESAALQASKEAVKASFPSVAPADALDKLGSEMQLPRAPAEPDDTYRARLQNAFSAWVWAGTAYGLTTYGIGPFGYTNVRIITTRDWAGLTDQVGGINVPDGNTAKWARFWIVAGRPPTYTPRTWDEWQPDPLAATSYSRDQTWGTNASYLQASALRQVIDFWRPAASQLVGIFIVPTTSTPVFDSLPAPGGNRWLEENATFSGGTPCTFWRYNGVIHTTP